MKARARFIVAVLCFTLVLAAVACPARLAFADQLDEKNQELRDLQKDIEEQKALIVSRQKTESSVLKEIGLLEQQVALAEKEIAYISARMTYLDRDIAENQDAIKELEDKLASQKAAYEARLTSIYKAGNVSYLEVLLESESLSDFFSRIRYLRDIAEQDSILIADYNAGREDLLARKATLEIDLADLRTQKRNYEDKRVEVASRGKAREEYLRQVQADRKKLESLLDEMEAESKALEAEVRRLQALYALTARDLSMIWPASGGWISDYYGNRLHPILGYNRFHSGIDYAANRGSPIKAAESGVVIFSGTNGGYGLCVIIDHGGGISTLYGHSDKLLVKVGQNVLRGDTIALVGSTGVSTGPHLHFEVRVNGETQNPLDWLP